MSPEQIAEARRWATHLIDRPSDGEAAAAGRAILLLVEEAEQLRAELESLNGRSQQPVAPDLVAAPASRPAERSRTRRRRTARRRLLPAVLILTGAMLLVAVIVAVVLATRSTSLELETRGPAPGALIGPEELDSLQFSIEGKDVTEVEARWQLDGVDVTDQAERQGGRLILRPRALEDGEHLLSVTATRDGAEGRYRWTFTVDTTAPEFGLGADEAVVENGLPLELAGEIEVGAEVLANGTPASVTNGRFVAQIPWPPGERVRLSATDAAGNTTSTTLPVVVIPRQPEVPVRSVHVTAHAWADDELRAGILALIDEGRINSVELDLKDESGIVGFDPEIPLGRDMGSIDAIYDLDEAVQMLHERGVRVVGRLVAFRDPVHAAWAWETGRVRQVVQTPDGEPYAGYGGFTNFANPQVRQYNIDVAIAAAKAGVDDILYDYIRRPDGPLSSMVFPGLKGSAELSIATFLAEAREQLRPYGVFLGASVFGVAATRPREVAQDIPRMAEHVDYIAPMLYPSHWNRGEYGVANPNAQPYDIVIRSLEDFSKQVAGSTARIVPWLQDFSLGVDYGIDEVRAQIEATRESGIEEWLLWDPAVTYTAGALEPNAPLNKSLQQATGSPAAAPTTPTGLVPNELGEIPVLMFHQIREDGGGEYDLTPPQFRAELERLYREHYRPITAADLVSGTIDVPAGTTPVVLTFDDSTREQFAYLPDGTVDPDSAVGILLDFAGTHPEFRPAGTFFVNREPFGGVAEGPAMLRWLHDNGFEIGNHTFDHLPFSEYDAVGVQRQIVLAQRLIRAAIPGVEVRTMSLPLGVMPEPATLALRGEWDGDSYAMDGVFLIGAEPAPSPYSRDFKRGAVPRIRTAGASVEFGSSYWLEILKENPSARYVSDGDPKVITVPAEQASMLRQKYRAGAATY